LALSEIIEAEDKAADASQEEAQETKQDDLPAYEETKKESLPSGTLPPEMDDENTVTENLDGVIVR